MKFKNIFHRGKNKEIAYCYKNYVITCYYIIKTSLFIFCSPHLRSLRLVGWFDYYSAASNDALNSIVIKFLFNYLFCIICFKQSMEMCWFYSYNKSSISNIIFNILHLYKQIQKSFVRSDLSVAGKCYYQSELRQMRPVIQSIRWALYSPLLRSLGFVG